MLFGKPSVAFFFYQKTYSSLLAAHRVSYCEVAKKMKVPQLVRFLWTLCVPLGKSKRKRKAENENN